jgi:GrpB-like predicted nucleotidyltransferase (UPF0157 family)
VSLRDEEISKITIGAPTVHDGPIQLVEYDSQWAEQFELEAARIRGALGARALRVEHVGSTSVPGMIAKPFIDIVLVVTDSADEPSYVPALEAFGYILRIREPNWHEHRLFKNPDDDIKIHVFSENEKEIDRMLLFRDFLRTHGEARERYANANSRNATGNTSKTTPTQRRTSSTKSCRRRCKVSEIG